jgi:hypothetical protein
LLHFYFLAPALSFVIYCLHLKKETLYGTKLDDSELVSFKELLMANSIQVDAAIQLLIEKGFFTQDEFFTKLKQVQYQYQKK